MADPLSIISLVTTTVDLIDRCVTKYSSDFTAFKDECVSFQRFLSSVNALLKDVEKELSKTTSTGSGSGGGSEGTSAVLQRPMELLHEAVQEGGKVLKKCCSKRIVPAFFASKKLMGKLNKSKADIAGMIQLVQMSSVAMQASTSRSMEGVSRQLAELNQQFSAFDSRQKEVTDIARAEVQAELRQHNSTIGESYAAAVVEALLQTGIVHSPQDLKEQLAPEPDREADLTLQHKETYDPETLEDLKSWLLVHVVRQSSFDAPMIEASSMPDEDANRQRPHAGGPISFPPSTAGKEAMADGDVDDHDPHAEDRDNLNDRIDATVQDAAKLRLESPGSATCGVGLHPFEKREGIKELVEDLGRRLDPTFEGRVDPTLFMTLHDVRLSTNTPVPQTFVLLPSEDVWRLRPHPRSWLRPSSVSRKYYLHFVCPVSLQAVSPPIKMRVRKDGVVKAAPALAYSLSLLQASMKAYVNFYGTASEQFHVSLAQVAELLQALGVLFDEFPGGLGLLRRILNLQLSAEDVQLCQASYELVIAMALEQNGWRSQMEPVRLPPHPKVVWVAQSIAHDPTYQFEIVPTE